MSEKDEEPVIIANIDLDPVYFDPTFYDTVPQMADFGRKLMREKVMEAISLHDATNPGEETGFDFKYFGKPIFLIKDDPRLSSVLLLDHYSSFESREIDATTEESLNHVIDEIITRTHSDLIVELSRDPLYHEQLDLLSGRYNVVKVHEPQWYMN